MGLFSFLENIPIVGDVAKAVGSATGLGGIAKSLTSSIPVVGDLVGSVSDEVEKNEQRSYNESLATTQYERQMALQKDQQSFNSSEAQKAREFNSLEAFKQRQWSAEQSQLTQDFNASEALKARTWQEQMWQKQNEYDSPSAQLSRLLGAGFSPALLGSQMANGSTPVGTSSASASSPSGSSASSPSASSGQGSVGQSSPSLESSQIRLNDAQSSNLEASKEKSDAEREGILTDNDWKEKLNSSVVELNNVLVDIHNSQIKVNEAQAVQIKTLAESLNEQVAYYKQTVENLKESLKGIKLDNFIKNIERENLPRRFADEHNVSVATANNLFSQAFFAGQQGKMLQFNLDVNKTAGKRFFVDRIRYESVTSKWNMNLTKYNWIISQKTANGTLPMSVRDKWQVTTNMVNSLSNGIATGASLYYQRNTANGVNSFNNTGGYTIPGYNLPYSY